MNRRDFLRCGVAAAAVSAFPIDIAGAFAAQAGGSKSLYTTNRSPLRQAAFLKLPPGSAKAHGWLAHQLALQVDGLNGRMPEISDYLNYDNCGWVDPSKPGWEELPYWLRGFGDLGYVTGDARVLALTRKWIDGIIKAQQPDGWFGPTSVRTALGGGPDFWPHMPALNAMQTYYDYSGDSRVPIFLTRYFRFLDKQPADRFSTGWGSTRWADTLDPIVWLYNRTGNAFLIDLAAKIHQSSADWVTGIPTWHNVNVSQGFREPAQFWVVSGDPRHVAATLTAYDTVMSKYGQFPGGGFAGDENCREGYHDPRQGFETCGYVELMRSFEILSRITGLPAWADRCEEIAFNSLPAAFDPEQKGLHYITSANCVDLDNAAKKSGQFDNSFAMQAYMPGVHNYRCCPHNYGMGWPNYVEEMWLATIDGGLCASMYGPSEVTAKVGDGRTVHIDERTDYPFDDAVHLDIRTSSRVTFPLTLRVPGWCHGASVEVNGKLASVDASAGTHVRVERAWSNGDQVVLRLPMSTTVRRWASNGNSASISHGPLTYSLAIDERWDCIGGSDDWREWAVAAGSPWNYGLANVDTESVTIGRKSGPVADNPFTPSTTPISVKVSARRLPDWQADPENVVGLVPQSPATSTEPEETITLIPMAAARLRITSFPVIG